MKYRIKWKFMTLYGAQRRQMTIIAKNKNEAIKKIYPFNPYYDKIVSVEKIKKR